MITKLDFVGIPSQDAERSRAFYVDTLGLRPDEHSQLRVLGRRHVLRHLGARAAWACRSRRRRTRTRRCTSTTSRRRAPSWRPRASTFYGETFDTGVCHMAFFTDPDGNDLMLHHRYAPRT